MAEAVESLSASGWHEAMGAAAQVVEDHAAALDELDGHGVGTDMAATLSAAVASVGSSGDLTSVSADLASGAREAAGGPAGRQLAKVLGGMREGFRNADSVDAERLALGLEAAAEQLAGAHDGRRPGRLAAVVSEAADAALASSDRGSPLATTVLAAANAGIEELERGPESDPVLAERGTVDPAGAGLLLVLDSLASIVSGEPLPRAPAARTGPGAAQGGGPLLHYEVSCSLVPDDGGPEAVASLEAVLAQMAELTRWSSRGEVWSVELTTPLPGAAVEAILEAGRPRDLKIALVDPTSAPPEGDATHERPSGSLAGTAG